MSEAPERIWIAGSLSEYGRYYAEAVEAESEHGGFAKEYIRADMHAAAIERAEQAEKALAVAKKALREISRTHNDQWIAGSISHSTLTQIAAMEGGAA